MDLDPEEAAALEAATGGVDEGGARVAVVSLRDFSEPRTLSADRIARIRKTLSARLGAIANGLAGPLRGHPQLALGEIAEMNAHGLFDGFVRPFLVHGFLCNGQQGWLVWDAAAARVACDLILSGPAAEPRLAPAPSRTPASRSSPGPSAASSRACSTPSWRRSSPSSPSRSSRVRSGRSPRR